MNILQQLSWPENPSEKQIITIEEKHNKYLDARAISLVVSR
jgi:hypothetical protein